MISESPEGATGAIYRSNWPTRSEVERAELAELADRAALRDHARGRARYLLDDLDRALAVLGARANLMTNGEAGDAPPFDRFAWLLGSPRDGDDRAELDASGRLVVGGPVPIPDVWLRAVGSGAVTAEGSKEHAR